MSDLELSQRSGGDEAGAQAVPSGVEGNHSAGTETGAQIAQNGTDVRARQLGGWNPIDDAVDWATDIAADIAARALGEVFTLLLETFLRLMVNALETILDNWLQLLLSVALNTPYPNNIGLLAAPTNSPWDMIYAQFGLPASVVLAPLLFGLVLSLVIFTNIFNEQQKKETLIRRLVFVFPFMFSWWWIGGALLRLNHELTMFLVGGTNVFAVMSFTDAIGGSFSGLFLLIWLYIYGLTIVAVLLVFYMGRFLLLPLWTAFMPVIMVLWCVPIDSVSDRAGAMVWGYVPTVYITAIVAGVIRLVPAIFEQFTGIVQIIAGFAALFAALIIPIWLVPGAARLKRNVARAAIAGKLAFTAATGGAGGATLATDVAREGGKTAAKEGTKSGLKRTSRTLRKLNRTPFSRYKRMKRAGKVAKAGGKAAKKTGKFATSQIQKRRKQLRNRRDED
jgi:hypothetical protein